MFLLSITILSEIATEAEVFDRLAQRLSRMAQGRLLRLYVVVAIAASLITVFLGLDTTAVLFTPVVIALAKRVGAKVFPFAMATLLLSNTASLLLPVSNLTNLLSQSKLKVSTYQYVSHVYVAAVVSIVLSIGMLLLNFRKSLIGKYRIEPLKTVSDKTLLLIVSAACILFAGMIVLNVSPVIASVLSALISTIAIHFKRRSFLTWGIIPWRLVLFTSALFATVTLFEKLGLSRILAHLTHAPWEILVSSAISANLFNNLPAYLAFESVQKTTDIYYVLIGTNFGSIVLPWGSLATLLWAQRCRANGLEISWPRVISFSAICALVIVPVTSLFL